MTPSETLPECEIAPLASAREGLRTALRKRDLDRVAQLVAELVSEADAETGEVIGAVDEVVTRLVGISERRRAAEVLAVAADEAGRRGLARRSLAWLKEAARLTPGEADLREELAQAYRAAFDGRADIESFIDASGLLTGSRIGAAIERMEDAVFLGEGDFVVHSGGWGVGKVTGVDEERERFQIDFEKKPGHEIAQTMAKKALKKLVPDHIDVLIWIDLERLKSLAADDPVELLRIAVRSLGGEAQLKVIRTRLSGTVVPSGDWTKWWGKARKLAGKDPLFEIGGAPRTILTLLEQPRDEDAEVVEKFEKAYTIEHKVATIRTYLRARLPKKERGVRKQQQEGAEGPASIDATEALVEMLAKLATELGEPPEDLADPGGTVRKIEKRANRLEAVALLYEARRTHPDSEGLTEAAQLFPVAREIPCAAALAERLRLIDDTGARLTAVRALEERAGEEGFAEEALEVLHAPALWDIFEPTTERLLELGQSDGLKTLINGLVLAPGDYPDPFAALARTRIQGKFEDISPEGADFVSIVLKALGLLDQLGAEWQMAVDQDRKVELRASMDHLRGTLLEKRGRHLETLAEKGTAEDVDRAFRVIRRNCGLTENQKYILERPLIKLDPDVVKRNDRAVAGTMDTEPDVILTTERGLQKRQRDLQHLLEVDIPENSRDIGRAARMGDLSENAEWSAAIERQQFLTKKAAELETELKKIEIIDPTEADTNVVAFGTRVRLRNIQADREEEYVILGPWDVEDGTNIISYLAPLARALTGKTPGTIAEAALPDGKARYEVLEIDKAPIDDDD